MTRTMTATTAVGAPDRPVSPPAAERRGTPVARAGILAYGVVAYALFFATFLYAIGFVGNWFVPKGIDDGTSGALFPSLAINAVLLSLFAVQHTVMARPWFKRWITRFIPKAIERSTFVVATVCCFAALFAFWQPLTQTVWDAQTPALRVGLTALSLAGYAVVLFSSFLISHFDLFGLRQTYLAWRSRTPGPLAFRVIGPYRLIRHPLMTGFLIAFWATPTMTLGHLFFAIMVTAYILVGIRFEERDLERSHGETYRQYRRSVRALVPLPRFK